MKRLLIIFALLLGLALPQVATAAPFAFGPVDAQGNPIFDDSKSLLANLEALNAASGGNAILMEVQLGNYDPNLLFSFSGIGYSDYVGFYDMAIYNGSEVVGSLSSGFDMGNEASIYDIYIEYTNMLSGGLEKVALADLTVTVMQFDGVMDFIVDGVNYTYSGGIFFAISIPGSGNAIDFILGAVPFSPSAVPVPGAVWLFGSGLAGLFAMRKRGK